MAAKRITFIEQFIQLVEERPRRLGCWRAGAGQAHGFLNRVNAHAIQQMTSLSEEMGAEFAGIAAVSGHHNQVGISARWITQYLSEETNPRAGSDEEIVALFNTAGAYYTLTNALAEVRHGARDFLAFGKSVRLPYTSDAEIDSLDRMLDLAERVDELDRVAAVNNYQLRDWVRSDGLTVPWLQAPTWIVDAFHRQAHRAIAAIPRYFASGQTIAGMLVDDFDALWEELMAWGLQMLAARTTGARALEVVGPLLAPEVMVSTMASHTGVPCDAAERFVDFLTLDVERCKDGALTPLVPACGGIVPVTTLITYNSPHRNALAILQFDPSTFGEAGRLLGTAGENAALEVFQRIDPGVLKATRVKLLRSDGTPAGDLDIVLCDPRKRIAAIFEIKWSISADGNAAVYRIEQQAIEKREQVVRLRQEYLAGVAQPKWPQSWPDMRGYALHWYVLTRDVLATRGAVASEVTIRSLQLLQRTLRSNASVEDVISALASPPVPPPSLRETEWLRFRYGDIPVEIELIRA